MSYQSAMSFGHTARWTAPEILDGVGMKSKEGDVFAFAMVMVEVYRGSCSMFTSDRPSSRLPRLSLAWFPFTSVPPLW